MAAPTTLPEMFDSINQSIGSVSEMTTKLKGLAPPAEGLSLLDVKNELLLSYLEHMVFLILLRLRSASAGTESKADLSLENSDLGQSAVKKLVELRLYLEKGVRPLEDKLRYQIEKALRAAEASERALKEKEVTAAAAAAAAAAGSDEDEDESGSGSSDDDASDGSNEDDEEDAAAGSDADVFNEKEVAASRPNRAAFVRPASAFAAATAASDSRAKADAPVGGSGVYRPPKIAPTMMPTTGGKREREDRRPLKSATMDEFIADEFSTAPIAQPSIGTNIAGRGRHMKTSTERQRENERREYEERNFVRLPKEGKKDRIKRARAEGSGPMSFGGEDWRGLGEGVDRINRLTQRKSSGGASGTRALLEKSRKRGIDTTDGPRSSGTGSSNGVIGERFQKRLRLQEMGRRDRGKKK